MLIAPGITAFLLTKRFEKMLIIAVIVSVFSTVTGTLISFHLDASTSACIVILQAFIFIVAQFYRVYANHKIKR